MGWDSCRDWKGPADIARELHLETGGFWVAQDGCRIETRAATIRPEGGYRIIWASVGVVKGPACKDPASHDGFIACVLTERRGGMWGYKFMDESMGPHYYGVPPEYLDMVPPPAGTSAERWRAAVKGGPAAQRAYSAARV